jgi:hypothetical protein
MDDGGTGPHLRGMWERRQQARHQAHAQRQQRGHPQPPPLLLLAAPRLLQSLQLVLLVQPVGLLGQTCRPGQRPQLALQEAVLLR